MQHRVSLHVTLDRIDLFRNVSIEIKFDFYFGATQTTRNNPHSWRKQLRLPLIIAYRACFIGQSFNFGSVATCSISKRGLISFFTNLDTKKILDREFLRCSTIRVLLCVLNVSRLAAKIRNDFFFQYFRKFTNELVTRWPGIIYSSLETRTISFHESRLSGVSDSFEERFERLTKNRDNERLKITRLFDKWKSVQRFL